MAPNNKPKGKLRKIEYSLEEKSKVLLVLHENRNNFSLTAKQTGISYNTIKNWFALYGHNLNPKTQLAKVPTIEDAIVQASSEMAQRKNDYYTKVYSLEEVALDRLKTLLPKCRSAQVVVNVLKILNDITKPVSGDPKGDSKSDAPQLFMQQIINSYGVLNFMGKETQLHGTDRN